MKTSCRYILDTCTCIFLLRDKYGIGEKIREIGIENCFISEITVAELMFGAVWSGDEANVKLTKRFCEAIAVLPISDTLMEYASLKTHLRKEGRCIDDFDLLIGCCALHYDMILVTENIRHLGRLPIKVENWVRR